MKTIHFDSVNDNDELEYKFCDDWLIVAEDRDGTQWFCNTEMWEEHAHSGEQRTSDFMEKVIAPAAKKRWGLLDFERFED